MRRKLLSMVMLCFLANAAKGQGIRVPEGTSSPIYYLENKVGIGAHTPNQPLHIYFPYGSGTLNQMFFGDNNTYERADDSGGLNCMVGEFGETDTDVLQMHGKYGLKFTTGNYQFGNYSVGVELNPSSFIVNKDLLIKKNVSLQKDFKIGVGIGTSEYYGISLRKDGLKALTILGQLLNRMLSFLLLNLIIMLLGVGWISMRGILNGSVK